MERIIALLAIISLTFSVSCSNDASVSALNGDLITDIILDDGGNVVDEEPIEDNEDIEDIVENGDEEEEIEEPSAEEEEQEIAEENPDNEEQPPVEEEKEEEIVIDELPVDPPICSMRKSLRVEKLDGSGVLGDISSYKGYLSAAMNYNYYSASAHPIVGPHPEEYEGHFFFYEGKEGLALNFFYNIDAGGSSNNQVHMEVSIKGNDQIDKVLLSDDGHEVKKFSSEDGVNRYAGKMHYWYNTDGGVIGPLKGEDFKIHVKIFNIGDNKTVGFHSADGRVLALETGASAAEAYSEFVIHYSGEVEDCENSREDDARNQCIKKIADEYQEDIESVDSWREKYRAALDDRKAKVKELAKEHKDEKRAIRDAFNKAIKEMRSAHKFARKAINKKHRDAIRSCNKDKESRKAGKCKAMAQRLKAERKSLRDSHKKVIKEMADQRKKAIKAYCADAKAKRKALAKELLKAAKELRKELRSVHAKVMKSFQDDIKACSVSDSSDE